MSYLESYYDAIAEQIKETETSLSCTSKSVTTCTVQQRSVSEWFVTSKQLMFKDSNLRALSISIMRLLLPVRYHSIMQNDLMTGSIPLIACPSAGFSFKNQ